MGDALVTQRLSRRFGELRAVDRLDLRVPEGQVFGFLGPNGAGKTTTLRMIAGLLRPTEGRIEVLGREVSTREPDARRLVGVCPQENVLYPDLTARENLAYAAGLYGMDRATRRRRADEMLDALGLAEKRDARAADLSGGMKRRLTLGLALAHDPPVLVLDEPEAGLDPQTRVMVRDFIRAQRGARTIILTGHNMDEVERLVERVAVIDHGRLLADGTPAELKAKVGGQDVLEVTLTAPSPRAAQSLRQAALGEVHEEGARLALHGKGLARRVPEVMEIVVRAGAEVADLRVRGASLEDVFLHLTGRGMRE